MNGLARNRLNSPAPPSTRAVPPVPSTPPGPSPEELASQHTKAEELRKAARVDCAADDWKCCGKDLGAAATLDPAGEGTRRVKRLNDDVMRMRMEEEVESKLVGAPRSVPPNAKASLVTALSASRVQAVHLVSVRTPEPAHLCDQLGAAMASAAWTVTRTLVEVDAGARHGLLVEVAIDADDGTQAAADALVGALARASLRAHGPDDAAPGGDALRVTVGVQ